ncbi:MAG: GTP-binding protein [Rickettsiales bacterium]|nr:GTP-binding protein [Rickettsiales bacterium]
MPDLNNPIPISVITGFLGSGKTTLLSALLKHDGMKNTAVIINEFGEVGLDHALIEKSDDNIVELQSGCICCTIRGDLHKTLQELQQKRASGDIPPFDKLLIETTGFADPVPIIHMLMSMQDLIRSYILDGVVTVVDAVNGMHTLDTHPESVKQAAMAERIILSKTDLADESAIQDLIKRLEILNPTAELIQADHGDVAPSALFGLGAYDPHNMTQDVGEWLKHEAHHQEKHHGHDHHHEHDHEHDHSHHHHDVNRHSEEIQAFSFVYDQSVYLQVLLMALDYLSGVDNADLLRVKSILHVKDSDKPAVIHGVQRVFHPVQWLEEWPDDDRRSKLVFITRNIRKEQIEEFLRKFMDASQDMPPPNKHSNIN